jgi:hypothetical protein
MEDGSTLSSLRTERMVLVFKEGQKGIPSLLGSPFLLVHRLGSHCALELQPPRGNFPSVSLPREGECNCVVEVVR